MLDLIETSMDNFPNDKIATLPNCSMVRSEEFADQFPFQNQEIRVQVLNQTVDVKKRRSLDESDGSNRTHAVVR